MKKPSILLLYLLLFQFKAYSQEVIKSGGYFIETKHGSINWTTINI